MGKKKELKREIRDLKAKLAECRKEQIGATEGPRLGDGSGDAALAIGEHAFYAGYEAGVLDVFNASPNPIPLEKNETFYGKREIAWSNYEPSEDIKELS